jgi:hypothetical protein
MLTDDIGSPDGLYAYLAGASFADNAVSFKNTDLFEITAQCLRSHFTKFEGGTTGGVLLLPVMGLDNFYIKVIAEDGRGFLDQLEQYIDADRHVRRMDAGKALRQCGELIQLVGLQSGCAYHHGGCVLRGKTGKLHGGFMKSEVDDHITLVNDRGQAFGDDHTVFTKPRNLTGIPAYIRAAGGLKGSGIREFGMTLYHGADFLSHSAGGTGNDYMYHILHPRGSRAI